MQRRHLCSDKGYYSLTLAHSFLRKKTDMKSDIGDFTLAISNFFDPHSPNLLLCPCLATTDGVLWHVSWSMCGTILSVSGEDNKVSTDITLWKENLQGQWHKMEDNDKA
ncbi:hypothetical protein NECAME_14127 [Necator americanus]|uniref:Uncharacterized protein n=1 Tax=Necator americanus TaxID=51031 RepID=W2SS81_NECAM|nr:hypothetical protein NECAME_14127 [Necator americanus]ETN71701.1 hypothetical protein NECAME_14127 [Necator americanus]